MVVIFIDSNLELGHPFLGDKLLAWERCRAYPILSTQMDNGLNESGCPEGVKELLDKALRVNLANGQLSKELTIYEAMVIDKWVSNNTKPRAIPYKLVEQLEDELGIKFKEQPKPKNSTKPN